MRLAVPRRRRPGTCGRRQERQCGRGSIAAQGRRRPEPGGARWFDCRALGGPWRQPGHAERAARCRREARWHHSLQDRAADAGRAEWQRGARRAAAGCWRQSGYGVRRRTDGAHDRGSQRQRRSGARAAEARRAGRPGGILPRTDGADVRRGRRQHGRRQAAPRVRSEVERALQGRLLAAALCSPQQPNRDGQVPVGARRQRQGQDSRWHVGAQHGHPERRFRPGRAAAGLRRRSERTRPARPSAARGRLVAPARRTARLRDERRGSASPFRVPAASCRTSTSRRSCSRKAPIPMH